VRHSRAACSGIVTGSAGRSENVVEHAGAEIIGAVSTSVVGVMPSAAMQVLKGQFSVVRADLFVIAEQLLNLAIRRRG